MSSLITDELGTKENPHIVIDKYPHYKSDKMKWPKKDDRIKGHWYLLNDKLRYCDNQKRLINKERDKEYREEHKEEAKLRYSKWYEENNEKVKTKQKTVRNARNKLYRRWTKSQSTTIT